MSKERILSEKKTMAQHIDLLMSGADKRIMLGDDGYIDIVNKWNFNGYIRNLQIQVTWNLEKDGVKDET